MLAAYNWGDGDPDRPTSGSAPNLVSRLNLLMAGAGAVAVGAWQCKRVGEKRRGALVELARGGMRLG